MFDDVAHDVNATCSNLKNAMALLKKATADERRELLSLMTDQARKMANRIAELGAREDQR